MLLPPLRFSAVEFGIFRGAYPTLKNYRFLKRLSLKTVISVTPEPPIVDLVEFCKHENIRLVHHSAEIFTREAPTVTPVVVVDILEVRIS